MQRRRDLLALAGALAAHAALLVYVTASPVKLKFHDDDERVVLEIVALPPVPPPSAPAPPSVDDVPPPRAPRSPTKAEPPPPQTAPPATPLPEVETTPPVTAEPTGESLLRLPKSDGAIGKVLGTGGEVGPTVAVLEGALDVRIEGPVGDNKRAARNAKKFLETDLADDEVTAGLANDYFRDLRNRVETHWRPAMKELNDGGESVTQIGMMKSVVDDRAAWDEMWRAYLDLAKQYAVGQKPELEQKRRDRIRELMRSRKGAFRFHAISEVILTQGPDGKVLTIEVPLPSGHPGIDEGVKDAIATAVHAMVDPPPVRVHHGRSFSSTWRMRATWTMVPPTAFLSGAGFDITPKGFTIDVPFDINLKTAVLLLRTDAHAQSPSSSEGDP